jgi:lipopolysaccharide biosynthesis protein
MMLDQATLPRLHMHDGEPAIDGLTRLWDFVPDQVSRWHKRQILQAALRHSRLAPAWKVVRPITAQPAWVVYFMYIPDGVFLPTHRFALSRLRDQGVRVMIVCAAREPSAIPAEISAFADALYWKALSGYDFSAYAIALREISRKSPHADVLVINDSVYGPFTDIRDVLAHAPWELTGFTASSQIENHIQSYAFVLKDVTPARMQALSGIMFRWTAMSMPPAVIAVQESRFARMASKKMTVGAYWYAAKEDVLDPVLFRPIELLASGFPFLKRSLLGKHQKLQNAEQIKDILTGLGHPLD